MVELKFIKKKASSLRLWIMKVQGAYHYFRVKTIWEENDSQTNNV